MPANSESIILHFGTKPHQIDAHTLLESLGAIETTLQGIARHGNPASELRIKVKPFQKGSFEVPVDVKMIAMAGGLALSSPEWATAKESVKVLLELIKLSLTLKGKKPKNSKQQGKNVEVTNCDGSTVIVDQRTFNIHLKDSPVTEGLAKSFQALQSDGEIKSFTVLDKKRKKLVEVPRRAFSHISKQRIETNNTEQRAVERTALRIRKAVFEENSKWDFYHRGFKIAAAIADEKFAERVKLGERFGRGDILDADLEILRSFDESVQTFVNKSYTILHVHRIERRLDQGGLGI